MDAINTKSRTDLKAYFVKNSIPTESNFADLINGLLNQKDDGVVKLANTPLSIEAVGAGDAASEKGALNFYQSLSDPNPAWTISLNPRNNPADPKTAHLGFNIGDEAGSSRFFIDSMTGNVGIGTTNPVSWPLAIQAKLASQELLAFEDTSNTVKWHINMNVGGNNPGLNFVESGVADGRLFIQAGGNVGIGTVTPNAKLDVRGAIFAGNSDIYFTEANHRHTMYGNAGNRAALENSVDYDALMILGRSGTSVGRRVRLWDYLEVVGTFVNNSDQRAKTDIEDLSYGLEEIKRLRPVSFNWKAVPNPHKSLGLIAQQVEPILNEIVYKDANDPTGHQLSLSYLGLIPVLINAIKELDARIENITKIGPGR
jgi:hypothetical protein